MKQRYSTISDYHVCPDLYRFKHVLGLKEPGKESLAMAFGTGMHLAMEVLFMEHDVESALSSFRRYWSSLDFGQMDNDRLTTEELLNNAEIFITRFDRLHKKNFTAMHLEKKMSTDLYEGTADFIGQYKGDTSIVDFKTSSMRFSKERIISNEQMHLYGHLANEALQIPVSKLVYVIFIKHKTDPSISVQTLDFDLSTSKTMENVNAVKKNIDAGNFYKNTKSCVQGTRICPFFDKCWKQGG